MGDVRYRLINRLLEHRATVQAKDIMILCDINFNAITRPTLREALADFEAALSCSKMERSIRERVAVLFSQKRNKLWQLRFKAGTAFDRVALNALLIVEPTDLLLETTAALVANDDDKITAILHDLESSD